jgi:Phage capsid family
MATDWEGLLPQGVAANILTATEETSVVLGLATTRPMAAGVESVPLVKLAPEAQFIGRGERKPIAQIEWTGARLEAEEVACVVAVADVDIQDAGPDLEASVERELGGAVARALLSAGGMRLGPSSPRDARGPARDPFRERSCSDSQGTRTDTRSRSRRRPRCTGPGRRRRPRARPARRRR